MTIPTSMQASDWLAAGSLVIAIVALWRSGRARVLDLRTSVLKDQADVRLMLDGLAEAIPRGLQSRQRVCAMGMGGGAGAAEAFQRQVNEDLAELARLRARFDSIPQVSALDPYRKAADASIGLHELRGRLQQLRDRYAAAWADDDVQRERRHAELVAHISRP